MIFDKNDSKRIDTLLETPKKMNFSGEEAAIGKNEKKVTGFDLKESMGLVVKTKKRPKKRNLSKIESKFEF
jgi:hypothetical protein